MPTDPSYQYVNSLEFKEWQNKIKDLICQANEQASKAIASRRLRYSEIDIEGERKAGRLAPDELYIPTHIIDANIRREQSSYVQYITQSNRVAVLTHRTDATKNADLLEHDLTNRLRYEGWQISMYANIDGFQAHGYSVLEVEYDASKPGHVKHEVVPLGDFGMINDTKDIQACEGLIRKYYFTKTKLVELVKKNGFKSDQVQNILKADNTSNQSSTDSVVDKKDKSLCVIYKFMFRKDGVVQVAWCEDEKASDWLREPRPLFIGRKEQDKITGEWKDAYETDYPYVLFQYLISENNTISQLKGRVYLDQDTQEAVSSLMSSYCTAHRRGAGLYFSKDTDDPNDDLLLQKNVFFRVGALINKKIQQFQLKAPEADMLTAIQGLVTANMQETSQINFAAQNRKDSRKTATEIQASSQTQQALSTVQVVLFSTALRQLYQKMYDITRSQVLAGLIQPLPVVAQMYADDWIVKPSGDSDVIERQQLVQQMMSAWPVMQNTPANVPFLCDLLSNMFPTLAPKYIQVFQQAQQQQQQQAQSQQAQMFQAAMQMANGVVNLSKHPEMFSDVGKEHALPVIEQAAQQIEQLQKQQQQQQKQQKQPQQV